MWNYLHGNTLKKTGINRKNRVLYPGPGILSSATWPSMPKNHYNRVATGQGKVREIQGQGKVREF